MESGFRITSSNAKLNCEMYAQVVKLYLLNSQPYISKMQKIRKKILLHYLSIAVSFFVILLLIMFGTLIGATSFKNELNPSDWSGFLSSLGSIGGLLGGIATCLAVYVAWKTKNEWFNDHHFQLKNELITQMFDLHMKGVKYCEFQHAIAGLVIQGINKSGQNYQIPEQWEKQAVKNLQNFDITLKEVIKQSYIVESLDFKKHKDITNRIITCANISLQLLQFTDLTEIKSRDIHFWEGRYSTCIEDKYNFEDKFRKEIISISNQTLGVSVDLRFLNLDTNFISIKQFIDI